jgi:NAD(P)-dependent dehydrogenase (short-subunit alcohol dehydrogenase family)
MSELPERRASVPDADWTGLRPPATGSTHGIGRAAVLALGRLGAGVVVHGRVLSGRRLDLFPRLEAARGTPSVADKRPEIPFGAASPPAGEASGRRSGAQQPRAPSVAARNGEAARRRWTERGKRLGVEAPPAGGGRQSATAADGTDTGGS